MADKKIEMFFPTYEQSKDTATAALSAGDVVLTSGGRHGFTLVDVAIDEDYAKITKCERVKAAKATGAITVDAPLYWDDTNKEVTTTSTDNTLIGFAAEAAESADTHVWMSFDGSLAFAKA